STAQQVISNLNFSQGTMGQPLSPTGGTQLLFNQVEGGAASAALVGGGGAAGTTTLGILPWAWSTTSSFVTYDPVNGVRPLNLVGEYATALPAAPSNHNVRLAAGAGTPPAGHTDVNA